MCANVIALAWMETGRGHAQHVEDAGFHVLAEGDLVIDALDHLAGPVDGARVRPPGAGSYTSGRK